MASGFNEKMDAVDLIINALKDHEKNLDTIYNNLKTLFDKLKLDESKFEKREEIAQASKSLKVPQVSSKDWNEFKRLSKEAKRVAFEIEDYCLHIYSQVNEEIFRYTEELPGKEIRVTEDQDSFSMDKTFLNNVDSLQFLIDRKLRCGLKIVIKSSRKNLTENQFVFEFRYDLDAEEVKRILAQELNISKDRVVKGTITY